MTTFSILNGAVISDNTGVSTSMRVLTWPNGVSRPLIDYCLTKRRSRSWQEKLLRAVKLFLEYSEVNSLQGMDELQLFANFHDALSRGTIDRQTHDDPTGLCWQPIGTIQVNYMISQLSDFFEWLGPNAQLTSNKNISRAEKFNPRYTGNLHDQRIDRQAFLYRRNKAFLGHTWSTNPKDTGRRVRGERPPKILPARPPMFPEERFEELLFKGFKVAGKYDYRGMLITLLLFGGGLRGCEPCHLYLSDVQPHWRDSSNAFVVIHHPSLGVAPNQWKSATGRRGSRREYLAAEFGLAPRNESTKAYAGWKHPALDGEWYMQVHWFPEIYGQWFMQIWAKYMEQIAIIPRNHPYAWINLDCEPVGGIYQLRKYRAALKAAVERIGLVSSKARGTTPHGLRHAYGQRIRKAEIDPLIRQRLMHHSSLESQLVYTQPELREATVAIQKGMEKLRQTKAALPNPLASSEIFDA